VQRMPKGQMRLYRRAARFRANSTPVRAAILKEEPLAERRTSLIPNPLTFTDPTPVDWQAKEKRILYAGRIHPEKGIQLLLEAFRAAKAESALKGWSLDIVGPANVAHGGGGINWFKGLLDAHPHKDIMWHGPIFNSDRLNDYYRRASLFVYPSLAEQGETFGLAPLEAMAWGAVPIVSDLACFKDFIQPDVNGFSFDHRNAGGLEALATALKQAVRIDLKQLGVAATKVRDTHSVHRIATEFLMDFQRVIEKLPSIT
jgi:glycosyltransferase involved in cell wall biosynthesis